ncbi:hypothetical protein [Halorussus ruber]|uniref:hypothetical protein n=1 Tax=Halorussus ruber TaxID=1126238 RepID=UPI001092DC08|nr:hypothetical protein [Halorussus ruber]
MSEKNSRESSKTTTETFDRRTYLKLAGMAGSGVGAGLGTGALSSEVTMPAQAASGAVFADFDYGSISEMKDHYYFEFGESNASLDTVSTKATGDASDSVLTLGEGDTKMISYDDDGNDLTSYPQVGDTITCWIRGANATENVNVNYGAVDGDGRDDHYYVKINMEKSLLGMGVVNDGSATWLTTAAEDPSFSTNTWYKLEIKWTDGSPNTHDVTLYDQNGNSLASFTYDGSDSADPNFEGRGFGYSAYLGSSSETAQFDYATTGSSGPIGKYQTVANFNKALGLSPFDFDRGETGAEIIKASEYSGPNELGGVYNGRRGLKIS